MQRTTIYAAKRFQSIVGASFLVVLAVVAHSHAADTLAIVLAVIGGGGAALLFRRPRLEIGPDGLEVVNFAHTYRLPWNEIAGIGFGSTRMISCLAIRRRDGSTVNAVAVTDDVRSGYSPQRASEIVAGLQQQLRDFNGSSVLPDFELPTRQGATRTSRRVGNAMWLLVCAFFVVFGVATTWKAASGLPQTYSHLSSHGVRATALFAGCRVTGIRDHECRLTLAYGGRTRTWGYSEDFPQFHGLSVGALVPVVVDPEHPTTVYTVHDVETRYDAGFGVLAIFGIVLTVVGVLGLAWAAIRWRRDVVTRQVSCTRARAASSTSQARPARAVDRVPSSRVGKASSASARAEPSSGGTSADAPPSTPSCSRET